MYHILIVLADPSWLQVNGKPRIAFCRHSFKSLARGYRPYMTSPAFHKFLISPLPWHVITFFSLFLHYASQILLVGFCTHSLLISFPMDPTTNSEIKLSQFIDQFRTSFTSLVFAFFSQKQSDCLKDLWKFWIPNLGIDSWIWRARTFFPFGMKIWKHFMQFKVPTLNILCTAGMQRRGHLGLEGDHSSG